MAGAGFFLALKGQEFYVDIWQVALTTFWFAWIGFGIGSIFSQKIPSNWLVFHWAATLALIAPFVARPIGSVVAPDLFNVLREEIVAGALGAGVGALAGLLAGTVHLRRLRRYTRSSQADASS
jgi:hypothetical protein